MANRSYWSLWYKEFREEQILGRFRAFLETVPFSAARTGFTHFTIRAVDASEPPVLEQDLRGAPLDAGSIVEIAAEQLHSDCSYEVRCFWDLVTFDATDGKSKIEPHALEVFCRGEDYEGGLWREAGHLEVDFGFEHLFTGHAGLLGIGLGPKTLPQSPEEARFLEAMAWPENLEKYQEKTRENIRKLLDWVRRVEAGLPLERVQLWSEGEADFEARLEAIVGAR
ncbi:MAG TPA: hypothetical protein VJO53_11720 [Candidatus Acidoferrales bacterium]|nr:hypothetical protein [Candidatus Acidoferrales bacterium]